MEPLLTSDVCEKIEVARRAGRGEIECSLDLRRSVTTLQIAAESWSWQGQRFPYLQGCKERTIYYWTERGFEPLARYSASLVKLVPTEWGPPTFEIDGIKMLPTSTVSPYLDAERKVDLIRPAGKVVLDTCGGLGYFAAWCMRGRAASILSYEKNGDVLWLRAMNPWSPTAGESLRLTHADVVDGIAHLPSESIDAVLHDPPRFGIAGELYSQRFYDQLARVTKRRGRLFHYTGTPSGRRGRDLGGEVLKRLATAGFAARRDGDGLVAIRG